MIMLRIGCVRCPGAYANGIAGVSLHSLAGRDKQDSEGSPLLNALVQALSSLPRVRQALLSVQVSVCMQQRFGRVHRIYLCILHYESIISTDNQCSYSITIIILSYNIRYPTESLPH